MKVLIGATLRFCSGQWERQAKQSAATLTHTHTHRKRRFLQFSSPQGLPFLSLGHIFSDCKKLEDKRTLYTDCLTVTGAVKLCYISLLELPNYCLPPSPTHLEKTSMNLRAGVTTAPSGGDSARSRFSRPTEDFTCQSRAVQWILKFLVNFVLAAAKRIIIIFF